VTPISNAFSSLLCREPTEATKRRLGAAAATRIMTAPLGKLKPPKNQLLI
jgi:hypothetical protein